MDVSALRPHCTGGIGWAAATETWDYFLVCQIGNTHIALDGLCLVAEETDCL